jgi:hypothetical protein
MKNGISSAILGAAVLVAVLALGLLASHSPRSASAATGALLQTVAVPPAAQCGGVGTSVAIVPGFFVNLAQYPILLVTSCEGAGSNALYFIDPDTAPAPASLVKTINTNPTPPLGWGSLSLRGDRLDLLGCGNDSSGTHAIYRIDINPFNAVPDGTATFMFNGANGNNICDGVAWDAGTDLIYQSPDVSGTIYRYTETGAAAAPATVPSPAGCTNSGLAVGGADLYASCNGLLTIHRLNKTTGAPLSSFPTAGQRTEDLECDPFSFASVSKHAMWSKDALTNEIFAFEIPFNTCGIAGSNTTVIPTCAGGTTPDADGDGLLDCWETTGIDFDGNNSIDFTFPGANKDHKDTYIEVDYMATRNPIQAALNDVIAAFAAAPVPNTVGGPGINLHITVDEAVPFSTDLAFVGCTASGSPDFDTVKAAYFGTLAERSNANSVNIIAAKRLGFRYSLFINNLLGLDGTSGCSELPGNDFIVSLGSWTPAGGNQVQQGGTFMHELGHTLNLHHGGADDINCKPNYLSVMSYSRQIPGWAPKLPTTTQNLLDYSRSALAALNEGSLNEALGVGVVPGNQTGFGPPTPPTVVSTAGAIDWNQNNVSTNTGVARDINYLYQGKFGSGNCGASPNETLTGYNDWANILYNFRGTSDFADGVHLSAPQVDEVDFPEMLAASPDSDSDGVVNLVDNCPFQVNPNQADSDGDGVGDVCDGPVGGISHDPSVGAAPLQSDSPSASHAWLMTGAAAITMASVVVLGGGAWYVRRRRTR